MIIRDRILGDITNGVQDMVVDAVVDKQSDLPAQNAVADFNIVTPSTCHCVQESTDWMMDSNGNWYKQRASGGGGGFDPDDYYTTTEIDNMLDDYYTSAQVDALLPDMTDYYTKTEVDNLIPSLTNYYTKSEVDALIPDMTLYYTSSETDSAISTALGNYYTKTQVDNLLPDMTLYYTSSQTDSAISTALSGYYTSSQVDSAIATALTGYYTSTQVDTLLGSYYTSAQTDSAISSYWSTNIANYYTKSEVDALIPTVPSTYDADDIVYDNTTSGLTATDVQDAIDEVVASIPTIPSTYDADDITYDNTDSGLTATNVQDAIDELAAGGGGGGGGSGNNVVFLEVGKNKICPFTTAEFGTNVSYKTRIVYDLSDGSQYIERKSLSTSYNGSKELLRLALKPNTNYIFSGATHASTSTYYVEIDEVTDTGTTSFLVNINSSAETTITTGTTGLISFMIVFPTPNSTFTYRDYWMIREQGESNTFEQYSLVGGTFITGGATATTPKSLDSITYPGTYWSKNGWWRFGSSSNGDQIDFVVVCEQCVGFIEQKLMTTLQSNYANIITGKYYYRRLNQKDGTWSTILSG